MGRIERLLARGERHFQRGLANNSRASLDEAIAAFTSAQDALPGSDPRRGFLDVPLGAALIARHQLADSAADLNAAILHLTRVLSSPDLAGDVDADWCHLMLGQALTDRIERYASPSYLFALPGNDEFMAELRTAIGSLGVAAGSGSPAVPPPAQAEAARLRAYLLPKLTAGEAMEARRAGRPADIEELERVLRYLPEDHPVRPRLILELGFAHMSRVLRDTTMSASPLTSAHREPAARYLSQALTLLAPDDPERGTVLGALAQLDHSASVLGVERPGKDRLAELVAAYAADPAADPQLHSFLQLTGMLSEPGPLSADPASALAKLTELQRLAQGNEDLQSAIQVALLVLLGHPSAPAQSLADQAAQAALLQQLGTAIRADDRTTAAATEGPGGLVDQLSHPALWQAMSDSDQSLAAFLEGDLAGVDTAIGQLQARLDAMPADHAARWTVVDRLGGAWRMRGALSGDRDDSIRGLRIAQDAARQALARTFLPRADATRVLHQRIVYDEVELGLLTGDVLALNAALRGMPALSEDPAMTRDEQLDWAKRYGTALIKRHDLTGEPADLDDGISQLEQACHLAEELNPGTADYAPTQNLSVAYWTRGDRGRGDAERAIDTGLRALRQRAAIVLLQSGAVDGLQLARWHGFTQVIQLVTWCVAEGTTDHAIEALELGRGLVLHAATVTADIPAQLAAAGQEALADQWRAETARGGSSPEGMPFPLSGPFQPADDLPPLRVPSALRRRVLGALRGTASGGPLLAPPDLTALAAGLRRAGADVFGYLIPPFAGQDGRALLLNAHGDLSELPLPGLAETDPLDAYESAYHQAHQSDWDDALGWHDALEALCDWAWTAGTGPLLSHVRQQCPEYRPPRLVIIPAGRLSLVPWHAARTTGPDGQPRYAVQDAVFSYAATAAQFARAASRPARSLTTAPVLVANPTGDLKLAESEVSELRRRFYPTADYLGQPTELATGPATSAAVLSRLPGGSRPLASLLHCGCHATVATPLTESRLLLGGGESLRIADILTQAQAQDPAESGFLGVLSACMTDLANKDHDEALTLASALLAAGASGVIGARWPVRDDATAAFMTMLHHFLANGYPRPADALRAAQLWMLDPARASLDDLPEPLADVSRVRRLKYPYNWAAFTCQGTYAP
jgi:hypothetical protein